MEHPSRKNFGEIFALAFKTYFSNFGKNLGFVLLIVLGALVLAIPYIISAAVTVNETGYPFLNKNIAAVVGFALSGILAVVAGNLLMPSMITGYLGPRTIDMLENTEREKGERVRIMFRSIGRVVSSMFSYGVIVTVLTALAFAGLFFSLYNYSVMGYYGGDPVSGWMIVMAVVGAIAIVVLALFAMFTKQVSFFEKTTWFKSVFRSFKLMKGKNFWPTLGSMILFGLVLMVAVYIIMIIVVIVIMLFALLVAGISGGFANIAQLQELSGGIIALIVVFYAIMIVIQTVYASLTEVYTNLLYFNARARTENIPFPGYVQPDELEK